MSKRERLSCQQRVMVGSLKKNTTLEYSTRVVQEGDRRCEKSTLNDLAYLTPLRISLMNPVLLSNHIRLGTVDTTAPEEAKLYLMKAVAM